MGLEQDILQIGFDYKKAQADADKVIAQMDRIIQAGEKFTASFAGLDVSGGFAASKKGAEGLNTTLKETNKTLADYNKSLIITAKAQEAEAKATAANEKAKQQLLKSEQEELKTSKLREQQSDRNAKAAEREAIATQKAADAAKASAEVPFTHNLNTDGTIIEPTQGKTTGAIVTDVEKLQVQGILTANEYAAAQRGVSASYVSAQANAKKYAVSQKEVELALIQDKVIAQQRNAELKNQVKEEISVKGSLDQRRAALVRLKSTYDSLAPSERNSAYGERLKSVIQGVNTQVLSLEKDTGRAQRNVGNYTSALTGAFSKTFGFLRQAAAVLPGIGLAGLIGLGVDAISSLVEACLQGTSALNRLSESHSNYISTLNEGAKGSAKEVANLRILEKVATDVSKPMAVRLEAVKDLQKEYPKYLGNLSQEAILNGSAAAQINLVADALYKKAFAEAASNKAAEFGGKQLDLELRRNFLLQRQQIVTKELGDATKEFNQQLAKTPKDQQAFLVNSNIGKSQIELIRLNNLLKGNSEEFKFNSDQIKFFTNKAAENFEVVKNLEIDPKEKKKTEVKTITDALSDLRKELSTIQKNFDIGQITFSEADVNRVKAYSKAFDQIFERGGNAKTPIVQQLVGEVRPINLRILERQIEDFKEKTAKDQFFNFPVPDAQKAIEVGNSYREGEVQFTEEMLQRELTLQQTASLKEQAILEEKFNTGKISREEYERDLLDIQERYSKQAVQSQINAVKAEIELMDFGTKEREDAEKRLAELILKYNGIVSDDRSKKAEKTIKEIQKIQDVFKQLSDLGAGLVNINTTNEKNALQDLEDVRQKNYQQELDRINSSTLSEQDKADKVKVLEATRQAQKDEFERKNREADQKRAKYDKAVNIANIIFETAKAVVHQLGSGDPYTAIPRAIAVGALGAAQLAIAIATPLPRYAKGVKNKSNDGYGIAGEAGAEVVKLPGQKPFIVDQETVMFMPRGTDVAPISKDGINDIMYRTMARQTAMGVTGRSDKSEILLMELIKETRKNNKNPQKVGLYLINKNSWEIEKKKYYS